MSTPTTLSAKIVYGFDFTYPIEYDEISGVPVYAEWDRHRYPAVEKKSQVTEDDILSIFNKLMRDKNLKHLKTFVIDQKDNIVVGIIVKNLTALNTALCIDDLSISELESEELQAFETEYNITTSRKLYMLLA